MELHWILIGIGVLVVVALAADWLLRKRSPGTISTGLAEDERGSRQREAGGGGDVLGPVRVARRDPTLGTGRLPTLVEPVGTDTGPRIEQAELFADLEIPAAQPAPAREMRERGELPRRDREGTAPGRAGESGSRASEKPRRVTPEEIIVVHVMGQNDERLAGKALLQAALNCGLRYGDYNIFHRFETTAHDSPAQFSMANAVEPGVFDLEAMESQNYVGISFFLMLPGPSNSRAALDAMIEAARRIAHETGGELHDQHHSILTAQTVEHLRQRVHEHERRRLTPRPE